MADKEFDPSITGQSIAKQYLSKRGWALEWRNALNRQLYAGFQREELEAKERQCDRLEEEAEDAFSRSVDRWRHSVLPQKDQVLAAIVEVMGRRNDLGFLAGKLVERLKRELGQL